MKKILSILFTLLATLPLLADDGATATAENQSSLWQTVIMIGIAIIFFYFILWRPEQKRRKEMERVRGQMKKGDKVTAMGIVGTIDRIKDTTVIVKMVDGSKIEMLKGAISEVKPASEGAEEEAQEPKA